MEPLISIIVPVYKVEQYLYRCVDSILAQTYSNMEIILIDDGSPDKCPSICDQYAIRDFRVKVLHKKNGGVSSARNAGLNIMNGKYVCFVDSDDYLPEDSIMKLYSAMNNNDVTYVVGMCKFAGKETVKNTINELNMFRIQEEPEKLLSYIVKGGSYSPYAKLYNSNIIHEYTLRFPENMKIAEDAVFIRTYLRYCDSVCLIPEIVYEYNEDNTHSLSKKAYEEYSYFYAEKMKSVEKLVESLPLTQERKRIFLAERGINGIRISINHYFANYTDRLQLIVFLKEILDLLLPWIDRNYDEVIIKNNAWWKLHYKDFRNGSYKKLFWIFAFERRITDIRNILGNIGRFIKNM